MAALLFGVQGFPLICNQLDQGLLRIGELGDAFLLDRLIGVNTESELRHISL